MNRRIEKGWAITGNYGLYVGWWLKKSDAIEEHCLRLGRDWKYCRGKGDRAVKVTITIIQDIKN